MWRPAKLCTKPPLECGSTRKMLCLQIQLATCMASWGKLALPTPNLAQPWPLPPINSARYCTIVSPFYTFCTQSTQKMVSYLYSMHNIQVSVRGFIFECFFLLFHMLVKVKMISLLLKETIDHYRIKLVHKRSKFLISLSTMLLFLFQTQPNIK